MSLKISTASVLLARRSAFAAVTAIAFAAAIPQFAFAADAGIWKVNPAKSNSSAGSVTLTLERAGTEAKHTGNLIEISRGRVYLVTVAHAGRSNGATPGDHRSALLIGVNARSMDPCGFNCQFGRPEPQMTLNFSPVVGAAPLINEMLAYDGQN